MTFDLRAALLKKEEYETGKLLNFEFRLKARAMRHTARALGLDEAAFAQKTVTDSVPTILRDIAEAARQPYDDVEALWRESEHTARAELVGELGDPSPHPLI